MRYSNWLMAVVVLSLCVGSVAAQGPGRGGPGGRGGGFFESMGGSELLRLDEVRKELEIVPEQEAKIKDIGEKLREEMQAIWGGLRDVPQDQREAKMKENREKMTAMIEANKKKIDEVLLPHQKERLKQLQVQSQMRFRGTADSLSSKELAEALGLTDEQKQKLADKSKEVQKDVDAKIEKVRQEGRDQILSVLTTEQQEKFKKLMGNPFKFENRGFGGGQGRPGSPPATPPAETK